MAENEVDSGQTKGTEVSPNTVGSQGKGDSSGSFDAAKLQATLEAVTKKLEEVDARSKALQGEKDRGVNQTKKEVAELKRQFAEIEKLKSSGLELEDAVEEFDFRESVRQLKEQLTKVSTQNVGSGTSGAVDAAKVFQNLGLDPKDPDVAIELGKGYKTEADAKLAAFEFREKRQNQPSPTGAQTPALSGEKPVVSNSESVIKDYEKELSAIPRGNTLAVSNLKAKYRKLAREKGFVFHI